MKKSTDDLMNSLRQAPTIDDYFEQNDSEIFFGSLSELINHFLRRKNLTKADVVTEGDHKDNKMVIKYENKAGETFTQEEVIDVSVNVPVYDNLEKVKEGNDNSLAWKAVIKIIIIILIIAIVGYALYRRRLRKQRILDEFANM